MDNCDFFKLKEIATKFNNLPLGDFPKNCVDGYFLDEGYIDEITRRPEICIIPEYTKKEDYIFALWSLGVKIPENLTFGGLYDYMLSNSIFNDSVWYFKDSPGIHNSFTYYLYNNSKYIKAYLWVFISTMIYEVSIEIKNNDNVNTRTKKLLTSPKEVFETASELDLVYYMLDLYNWVNVDGFKTFIDYVSS